MPQRMVLLCLVLIACATVGRAAAPPADLQSAALLHAPPLSGQIDCGVELMRAPDVWSSLGITGEGVVVALIDTGCCITHPDLVNQIWVNEDEIPGNNIDDDNNGYVDDVHGWNFEAGSNDIADTNGHGTHLAGTIAGDGSGGVITGMAPDAAIMTLKMFNNIGGEPSVWDAMQYAVDNGADVIVGGIGWPHSAGPDRATWREVCERAMDEGVIVIYQAGGLGRCCDPVDNITTPGDVPYVITVGTTDCNDILASFSGRGPVTWESVPGYGDWPYPPGRIKPTVTAPGINTVSTKLAGCSGYVVFSGSAMATAHAGGTAALMRQAAPHLDQRAIHWILEETAIDLGPPGRDNAYGAGRINAFAAVEMTLEYADAALPSDFRVPYGSFQEGALESLFGSDDAHLIIEQRPAASVLLPLIRLEVDGTAHLDPPGELCATVETATTALPTQPPQRWSWFDFDAGSWTIVDERTTTLIDLSVEICVTADPARYVGADRALRMRLDWFDPGNVFSPAWGVRVDQALWTLTP